MLNVQNILVTAFVLALKFLVPTVVWITVTAGLLQLIYGRVHRVVEALSAVRKPAQRSAH